MWLNLLSVITKTYYLKYDFHGTELANWRCTAKEFQYI
jgi:hypothetical protein